MAQKLIIMELIKQIEQLHNQGIAIKEIVRRTKVSRNSVRKYLHRLKKEAAASASTEESAAHLLTAADHQRYDLLLSFIKEHHEELRKTGVTRGVLWKEYLDLYPNGYSYSQFCYHLAVWLTQKDVAMHLEYTPADMMMIDFAGKKLSYTDRWTGEVINCEVFIGILPYSGLIFCHAVPSQKTAEFTECINKMLFYFGGVSATILCDNLKTAVVRSDRYEPVFTEICHQLSDHYSTTFSATRPYQPRDKAMVEKAVSIVYTDIYAPIRHEVFDSIAALNRAINQQLDILNHRNYKKSGKSRFDLFDQHEQYLLKPLPTHAFAFKKVATLTVQRNYHVQLSETRKYYSVPYQYAGKKVKVLYDKQTVEIYNDLERIAIHSHQLHHLVYYTIHEHMPLNHQKMKEIRGWTREGLLAQAKALGDPVMKAAELILSSNSYEVQNYKSCHGMMMLEKHYGQERLQAACSRALLGTRVNYTMIKNILRTGLDKISEGTAENVPYIPHHDNIRGKNHYQ